MTEGSLGLVCIFFPACMLYCLKRKEFYRLNVVRAEICLANRPGEKEGTKERKKERKGGDGGCCEL